MMDVLISMLYVLLTIVLAPFVAGIIKTAKARFQNRRGPRLFQSYFDLWKLFGKGSVTSPTVSWIFKYAPYVYFATAVAAVALVAGEGVLSPFGDLFLLIYILALGRFALALASLDAGSAFGGMGGSREMYVSVLVEPALLLSLLSVALRANTSQLEGMRAISQSTPLSAAYVLAALAFFIVIIAETGRIPVDNPDTHLELTMIHEGMTLEYSGRSLALIHWASMMKQMTILLLFVRYFVPWNLPLWGGLGLETIWFAGKVLLAALLLAAIETSTNKMRLFRLPGFLGASCLLSILAFVVQ